MEDISFGYRFLLLLFIVGANALFASAEMALVSVRPSRLKEMAAEGTVGAQAALALLARPERLLSTVQVGVTLAGLGAGWAGEETVFSFLMSLLQPVLPARLHPALHVVSFVLAFLVLTYIMVVLGEVVPKQLGMKRSERFAVIVAPILLVFYRMAEPFVYVLERSAGFVSRILGLGGEETGHSIEELKLIASSVRASGRLKKLEEEVVHRTLDLPEITVREIMVPRNAIVSVSANASLDQVLRVFAEQQHARIPVYDGDPEHILGILHYKDLLPVLERLRRGGVPAFRLRSLIRTLLVVPESKPLDDMIDDFRREHAHMALVVDEFGTIAGLVTLEDVLEQVFGEIEDEHDVGSPRPALEASELELDGSISIRDLEMHYGIELPGNAGFETLAGFLLYRLGSIPAGGEVVEYDSHRFTILEMDRRRIARVRIEKTESPAE